MQTVKFLNKQNRYWNINAIEYTFNAPKSISSSEQFTEEAIWCAILTYMYVYNIV